MSSSSIVTSARHFASQKLKAALPALAAGLGIALIAFLHRLGLLAHLIAPLGASATLVWMVPKSPLARARAVIGGSLVASAMAFAVFAIAPISPISLGLAVGLAIFAMTLLDVLHAPAGALPLVIAAQHPDPVVFLATLAASTIFLVLLGMTYHRLTQPRPVDNALG